MARNFLPFPFSPYNGVYSSKAFDSDGGVKGLMVGTDILWGSYLANGQPLGGNAVPNFAVVVNLNAAGPNSVSQNWFIQSVYIDNEGVSFPVYIFFPDTQFTVSCPANAAGWYQVFTNARQALICGRGIDSNVVTSAERTRVFFTDVPMVPSLDEEQPSSVALWLGTNNVQNNNSGFGTPALGDIFEQVEIPFNGGIALPVPGLSITSGFLYITQIQVTLTGFANNGASGNFIVELNNDIDGPQTVVSAIGGNNVADAVGNPTIIHDIRGNLRYRSGRNWQLTPVALTNLAGGLMTWSFVFTTNPE